MNLKAPLNCYHGYHVGAFVCLIFQSWSNLPEYEVDIRCKRVPSATDQLQIGRRSGIGVRRPRHHTEPLGSLHDEGPVLSGNSKSIAGRSLLCSQKWSPVPNDREVNFLYDIVQKCSHWPRPTDNIISWCRYRSVSQGRPVWINHFTQKLWFYHTEHKLYLYRVWDRDGERCNGKNRYSYSLCNSVKQESILVVCALPTWKPYVLQFHWLPPNVTRGEYPT